MENIDEVFRFLEKLTIVKDCCNKDFAQRKAPCVRIYRKCGSACALQHVLRFKECLIEMLSVFRRRIPYLT